MPWVSPRPAPVTPDLESTIIPSVLTRQPLTAGASASGAPVVILPCAGVVSTFYTTGPELDYWLRGKNDLCNYLVQHTVDEVNTYAAGKVWSRVIWDVTAVAWLLNDNERFLQTKLIPTPIPEYDHHYGQDFRRPLCRYTYAINRDALFGDVFAKLARFE